MDVTTQLQSAGGGVGVSMLDGDIGLMMIMRIEPALVS